VNNLNYIFLIVLLVFASSCQKEVRSWPLSAIPTDPVPAVGSAGCALNFSSGKKLNEIAAEAAAIAEACKLDAIEIKKMAEKKFQSNQK
jgi:hypothetical protein